MHTVDMTDSNIGKIGQLFPNCLTERIGDTGQVETAIDFDILRQELSKDIVEGLQERYQFTWPNKKESIRLANAPSTMTLRPKRERSVNFDTTENIYIEGDNLEALKLLREDYLGKVRVIYIDPPYNTGNDFVYEDDYVQTISDYLGESGQFDDLGNRMIQNTESNGRFHTDWLNMMYPRIKVAKDFLSPDGVIFISIDDNELANLRKICDEIFGIASRIGIFKWNKTSKAPTLSNTLRNKYEYVLCYANKQIKKLKGPASYNTMAPLYNIGNPQKSLYFIEGTIDCQFDDGIYPKGIYGSGDKQVELLTDLVVKDGVNSNKVTISARFKWSQETTNQRISNGQRFAFKKPNFTTMYYYLDSSEDKFIAPSDLLNMEECNVARNDEGYMEVYNLFDKMSPFDYCKPTSLIQRLIDMIPSNDIIVMDFFSGSGTTAHAVMKLNAEDGGTRKFLLVQLPEETGPKSEAYKAGYKTICEIGEERIRRAGKKIIEEQSEGKFEGGLFAQIEANPTIDIGFRVLKLDSSNMQDIYYRPEQSSESSLFEDNIKSDRTSEDLLFQVMLECNLPLSAKIETSKIAGKEVFSVNNGYLIACFDEDVKEDVIKEIAKQRPYFFVMRDSSLSSDNVADNFEQIFQAYSKETIRKIL